MVKAVPVFRIVPNGIAEAAPTGAAGKGAKDGMVRLGVTLLVTPMIDDGADAIDLASWPQGMVAWFERTGFRTTLCFERADRQGAVRPCCSGTGDEVVADLATLRSAFARRHSDERWAEQWKRVVDLWTATIGGDTGFEHLKAALVHSTADEAFAVDMGRSLPDDLGGAVRDSLDGTGAITSSGSGQGQTETIASVLAIGHADVAAFLAIERGRRARASMATERPPLVRGVSQQERDAVARGKKNQERREAEAEGKPAVDPEDALQAVRTQRLLHALGRTATARKTAKAAFEQIEKELAGKGRIDPPGPSPAVARSLASPPDVATHQYGTWPQRGAAGDGETTTDRVTQAFFAMQSSATLSRIFGLAFDAEITLTTGQIGTIPDDDVVYGFLFPSASHCDASRAATAARIRFRGGRAVGFLPATRAELMLSATCPKQQRDSWLDGRDQRDGLVPLGAPMGDRDRFELSCLDVRGAIDQAVEPGPEDDGPGFADPKDGGHRYATPGFTFIDRRRNLNVMEELAVVRRHKGEDGEPDRTVYADDLGIGDAIDVRVEWPGEKPSDWRCLLERHVEFDPLEDLDAIVPALVGARKSLRRMDLECGMIAAATRVMPNPALAGATRTVPPPAAATAAAVPATVDARYVDLIVEEALATWTGAPMGVDTGAHGSRLPQDIPSGAGNVVGQTTIHRAFSLPGPGGPGAMRRGPVARYGVPYRFAMRRRYQGGGGLSLADAAVLYADASRPYLLPRHGAKTLRRNESILAPDVLMLTADARREYGVMGFENSLEVVLRRSNGTLAEADRFFAKDAAEGAHPIGDRTTPKAATRLILPPTVGMEEAARHGMFDGPHGLDIWRRGAMPRLLFRGGYPKCVDGREGGWDDEQIAVTRSGPTFAPGQGVATFKLRSPPGTLAVEERVFPDPAARFLVIRLVRDRADAYLPPTAVIPFYARGVPDRSLAAADYDTVVPVRLTFEVEEKAGTAIVDRGASVLTDGGQVVRVHDVAVRLAASDDVHVHLWCIPDLETLRDKLSLIEFMAAGGEPVDAGAMHRHIQRWPVPELGAVQSISAVHAVNRPAEDPVIELRSPVAERRQFDGPPGTTGPKDLSGIWLDGSLKLDLRSTDTYEIYMSTASPSGEMDDPGRGRSLSKRRAGAWPMIRDPASGERRHLRAREVFGFEVEASGRVGLPTSVVQLVRGDHVAPDGVADGRLDLAGIVAAGFAQEDDSPFGKVAIPFAFPDRKARRMVLRPVAMGRHASKFETRATFGTETGRRQQRRAVPLSFPEQCKVGQAQEVWLDAAMRPSPPVCDASEPSFSLLYRRDAQAWGTETIVTCRPNVRVRMPRPWFSSGEGERLGIVLAPEVDRPLSSEDVVSRWGSDPIWPDTKGERRLRGFDNFDLARCRHRHKAIPDYELPARSTGGPAGKPDVVALLLFEPHFDVDRQEWYVDVPLEARESAQTFAQLVLVRYQEHTAPAFPKVSEPVTIEAGLMPTRCVSAVCRETEDGDWQVVVTMEGMANGGPEVPPALRFSEVIKPRLSLRLFHESGEQGRVRRVDASPECSAALENGREWTFVGHCDEVKWTLEAVVRKERRDLLGQGCYGVFLAETQRFLPATYTDDFPEPVRFEDMGRPETLVTTGSRFSLRIDLQPPCPGSAKEDVERRRGGRRKKAG